MPWEKITITDRESRIRQGYAVGYNMSFTPGRASDIGVLSAEIAAEADDLHQHTAYAARQIHSATADEENLLIKGRAVNLTRLVAIAATGEIIFTGTDGSIIASGTLIKHADGREYLTKAEITIIDGTATAAVAAVLKGATGNLTGASKLSLISPIEGVNSAATVIELTGGSELEALEAYRARILFRQAFPPGAGHNADYISWAMMVPGVTAVWVKERAQGLGTITIRIAAHNDINGPIPSEKLRQAVANHLDGHINPVSGHWAGRPAGMEVFVIAPVALVINLEFSTLMPNNAAIKSAIITSMNDMLRAKAYPGCVIRLDWINEAISKAVGEDYHRLTTPAGNVICGVNELPVMGKILVGGV